MPGFRQRSLHPLARRLRQRLFGWLTNLPPRSQRVYEVTIRGERFKRVVFPDSHAASTCAAGLRAFGDRRIWPSLVFQRENELWVEFVDGRRVERVDDALLEKLADLLAVLYTREPRCVEIGQAPFLHELHVDLDFLRRVGVLAEPTWRALDARAGELAPRALWVGYDCTDLILKNFLLEGDGGALRCIDVECLGADQLLGTGVAKASLRWLGARREDFLRALRKRDVPDFQAYLPFVELCFLAFWAKSSFLERKHRFVDPSRFDRFLRS